MMSDQHDGPAMDPEVADVYAANRRFYDAHESRDLGGMSAVWEHSDRVVCILSLIHISEPTRPSP